MGLLRRWGAAFVVRPFDRCARRAGPKAHVREYYNKGETIKQGCMCKRTGGCPRVLGWKWLKLLGIKAHAAGSALITTPFRRGCVTCLPFTFNNLSSINAVNTPFGEKVGVGTCRWLVHRKPRGGGVCVLSYVLYIYYPIFFFNNKIKYLHSEFLRHHPRPGLHRNL